MIGCLAANGLWALANAPAYLRFCRALRQPRQTQERLLLRFLRRNAGSEYGQRHGYAAIRSVREFQKRVPIVTYDDLEPWVERICNGRPNILTTEPVLRLEKTSGSSSAAKYIPYTASLLAEFQNAVGAWMFDLFTRRPGLLGGAQYWSISPAGQKKEVTSGGLSVGFDDDTDYFRPLERWLLRQVLAVPGSVCRVPDIETNRSVTLDYLRRCRHLRFISVWSPSFLTLLMSRLPSGTRPRDFWPDLQLISCWTSGGSARYVAALRDLFPGVEIQGKGLLATEGVVSIPLIGGPASAPALTSHFLEFVGADGQARLVDEIEVGARYRVLLTTGAGFARYDLGDMVDVVAPAAIEFIGRADSISDLCGEKLNETFVGRVLEEATGEFGLRGFLMLAPEESKPLRYVLFVEAPVDDALADFVDRRLRAAFHYDYCRKLGQLGPIEVVRVCNTADRYLQGCIALGQRAGNVKPAYLRREFGWRERLGAGAAPLENHVREVAHARS
jgi:hypothetical protein